MKKTTRGGLKRLLAGILAIMMTITADGTVLWAAPLPGEAESAAAESFSEETVWDVSQMGSETTDATDCGVDGEGVCFTLTPGRIQYGEDGSNASGNLDVLFAPELYVDGQMLVLQEDYCVRYRFFTHASEAEAILYAEEDAIVEAFETAETVALETIPAGTGVTVVALAQQNENAYLAVASFCISKRQVVIRYTAPRQDALEGRALPEDGRFVLAADGVDASQLQVAAVEEDSFAGKDELRCLVAQDIIDGDVVLDVSNVDVAKDGYQTVPAELMLTPSFDDNYEVVGNIFGDVYVKKAQYYVTFTVNNNGEQWSRTYTQEYGKEKAVNAYGFYDEMCACVDALLAESSDTELIGWNVYLDSHNIADEESDYQEDNRVVTLFLNPDASTYERSGETYTFKLSGKKDYHFVANVCKAVASDLYVTTIPSVCYDGRAHVAIGTETKVKKQSADLRITVCESKIFELFPGQDYTVTYQNNTQASMRLVRDGEEGNVGSYVRTWTDNSQRPKAIITGKGKYKGFTAEIYFDILPVSLGATESYDNYVMAENSEYNDYSQSDLPRTVTYSGKVQTTGYSSAYGVKNAAKIKQPKVTKEFGERRYISLSGEDAAYATFTLKEGKDYIWEYYRLDPASGKWIKQDADKANQLSQTGNYLGVIRGIGNYCGAVYDAKTGWADGSEADYDHFDPEGSLGTVTPAVDLTSPFQFQLIEDEAYDFSSVKINIKQKSLPYAGTYYDGTNFLVTLKDKKGRQLETSDFSVRFLNADYSVTTADAVLASTSAKISAAGTYTVLVYPAGKYCGNGRVAGKIKITGMKLKASYFRLQSKVAPLGEKVGWELTEAGKKAGLSDDWKSAYYVGGRCNNISASYYKQEDWLKANKNSLLSGKVTYQIGGVGNCGSAIDSDSVVRLQYTHKKLSLKDALATKEEGLPYLEFKVPESAAYRVGGAIPERIEITGYNSSGKRTTSYSSINQNGYSFVRRVYNENGDGIGFVHLTFTIKNNKKVGQKASVIVSAKGIFNGKVTVATFDVEPCAVNQIEAVSTLEKIQNPSNGRIYAVCAEEKYVKDGSVKPKVKLYQAQYESGKYHFVPINAKQYAVESVELTADEHAGYVSFKSTCAELDFSGAASVLCYYRYDNAKLPAVKSVRIGGTEYEVKGGKIQGFSREFTGETSFVIKPTFGSITFADGTELNSDDICYTYGSNMAAGKNAGSMTVQLKYNPYKKRFPYKGKFTLKFDITATDKIVL